jgi:predicted nucleotidyltransferase
MSKNRAKKIVNLYAKILKKNQVSFFSIYLFGSYVNGQQNQWSDIDVLVVAEKLSNYLNYKSQLWRLTRQVDTRIEPHICTLADFREGSVSTVFAAKKHGVKIA